VGAYRRLLVRLGRYRWFSWLTYTFVVPFDRWLYRRSGGRLSVTHVGRRAALPELLITTTGRRSGQPRTTPVIYLEDGGRVVVVGSNFGREAHPAWSGNLLADPHATIRIHDREQRVFARPASDADVRRLWPRLLELYPAWQAYTERTDRTFRVFFLDPAGGEGEKTPPAGAHAPDPAPTQPARPGRQTAETPPRTPQTPPRGQTP
jgi:deazaflavin-dependent oxidoreductase (nitroreductase family)